MLLVKSSNFVNDSGESSQLRKAHTLLALPREATRRCCST